MAYAITIPWLVFLAYWFASWRQTKRSVYRAGPIWRISFIFGFLILLRLSKTYPAYFRHSLLPHTLAIKLVGLIICASGIAFAIWARRTLGRNWSADPTIKEEHELVETGPYRFVRHPIYTGMLLAIFGTGVWFGRVLDLYVLAFIFAGLCLKLKIEEGLMTRQFPDAYPDYKRRTKALVPFVF